MRSGIVVLLLLFFSTLPIYGQSSLEDLCGTLEGGDISVSPDFTAEELQAQIYVTTGMNMLQTLPSTAVDMFNQAIDVKDDYADAYLGRGCALLLQGETTSAEADFDRFVQLTDNDELATTVQSLLGGSTTPHGEPSQGDCVLVTLDPAPFDNQEAAQDYVDSFNESVKSADYLMRSDAYLCLGDLDAATVDLTTHISQHPADAEGYAARGILYRRLGEYDLALDDFNDALEILPDYTAALNGRAYTYYLMGEYELCISGYDESIALDDQDAIAFGNRGLCYGALGDDETAIENYNMALEVDPTNAIIIGNRAVSYRFLEEYDLALEDNNLAIELDPFDPFYYVERGLVYYELAQYRNAEADFEMALELDPEDASAWLGLGDTQRQLKNNSGAVESYQRYLELVPNSRYAEELEDFIAAHS